MINMHNAAIEAALESLFAVDGQLDGATIALFKARAAKSPAMVIGDFTLCDFTGSTPEATSGWAIATDGDGRKFARADFEDWSPSNATNLPQIAAGYVIQDADENVVAWADFGAAIEILEVGQIVYTLPVASFGDGPQEADGGSV